MRADRAKHVWCVWPPHGGWETERETYSLTRNEINADTQSDKHSLPPGCFLQSRLKQCWKEFMIMFFGSLLVTLIPHVHAVPAYHRLLAVHHTSSLTCCQAIVGVFYFVCVCFLSLHYVAQTAFIVESIIYCNFIVRHWTIAVIVKIFTLEDIVSQSVLGHTQTCTRTLTHTSTRPVLFKGKCDLKCFQVCERIPVMKITPFHSKVVDTPATSDMFHPCLMLMTPRLVTCHFLCGEQRQTQR